MQQDILIDFVVDYKQLDSALATLENFGKVDSKTASAFRNTNTAIKSTEKDTKGLIQTFNNVKGSAQMMGSSVKKAFDQGVQQALKEAGVSTKEFDQALRKASSAPVSLRQELKNLTQAMAQAKVDGKDLGVEFENMRKRAGLLKDSMKDAAQEISNAGSDTRNIDNVVGSVSALAGGFAVAQGAAALFGKENEDVQRALLKVNGAMAISQGLQQVSNALTKEGSLTKLADSIATGFQTAAQKVYTAVTGKATAATVGFKLALASTGILAIVGIVYALAEAMGAFSDNTDDAADSFSALNTEIERNINLSNKLSESISHRTKLAINDLKLAGASETEQQKRRIQGLREQQGIKIKLHSEGENKILEITKEKNKELEKIDKLPGGFDKQEFKKKIDDKFNYQLLQTRKANDVLLQDANAINKEILESNSDFSVEQLDISKKSNKKAGESAIDIARKAQQKILEDRLALAKLELREVIKFGQEEVDAKNKVIQAEANLALNQAELTENQKSLIQKEANDRKLEEQKIFFKTLSTEQLEGIIAFNEQELAQLNITNERKLELTLTNLQAQADLETLSAEDNAAKKLQIETKLGQDIRNAIKTNLQANLEDEIAMDNLRSAEGRRALERLISDEKVGSEIRINAIKEITRIDSEEIQKRIKLLELFKFLRIISDEDYLKKYAEFQDKLAQITTDGAAKTKGIKDKDRQDEMDELEEIAQKSIDVALKVADFFSALNQLSTDQENQRILGQKRQLDELIEAGAITKKQAEIRAKEIEIQERRARQAQAIRDKRVAVFRAVIAIPQAILEGLSKGGPILAAIYGALAAAQAAIIIAKPIPKFAKGKKGNYSGLGEVGDAGAELVQQNGRMYLASKPTIMYLGEKDKVFTAHETKQILHSTDKKITNIQNNVPGIDYNKLGKTIAKNQAGTSINIDKEFISESVANGLIKNNYFNNRYSFK